MKDLFNKYPALCYFGLFIAFAIAMRLQKSDSKPREEKPAAVKESKPEEPKRFKVVEQDGKFTHPTMYVIVDSDTGAEFLVVTGVHSIAITEIRKRGEK